ncbi:MAG: fibronectin type III domain-containing protein, partial [Ruminococcus sp.]|nr:fibronectin type III domain-containing protein [Ruminococcus sp.]
ITDSGVYNIPTSLEVAEYQYVYAGLTWSEYWENENVFLSGTDMTASSDELDAKGETDKGAFDVVSRATTNHGLHRGSYQCMATIYDTEGNAYKLSHWSQDGSTLYLTDGTSLGYKKGTLSLTDGTTKTMDYYEVTGIKYVPVKVKSSEYKEFCKLYPVTKNNASLVGGYGENKLSAYSEVAEVSENTNGLKTTEKQADGTFKFSERSLGSDSGLKDVEQKKATDITVTVRAADDAEAYGAFLRVDLNGEGYGALGANLQTVRWDYYGNDSSYKNKLVSYGTKFAADNWMHKSMGIQLGLTDSLRCQLPEGTDGTGYWRLTVYALGYKDFTFDIQANEENIVKVSYDEVDITALADVIQKAEALKQSDYTAQSWDSMITELQEAKDEIAAPHSQAAVNEAVEHLNAAILALEKALKPISEASIKLNTSTYTYDGSEKKPSVTIKDGTTTLIADSDYTVSYSNNINIGTATVTVTGKGSYMGSVKMNFNIIPATASNFKASSTSASAVKLTWNKVSGADGYIIYKYDNAKKTWVRVAKTTTNSNTYTVSKLSAGTTYKFAVKAYKTVSGKEITSSSYPQLTTTTNPANITKTNFTTSANTVKMSWNKVSGATGYRVYQYNTSTKKWKSVANTKNTSYTFSKLSSGTTYKFTVRAYKTLNGTTYLSPKYSTFTTSTNPTTVSFKLTAGSKKATVKWNKVSGATGYKVYYKTSKNGKWVALKTTTGTSYTKTGLTKGKTYYFTVKAYRTVGGKTYNASYATKSVKVK